MTRKDLFGPTSRSAATETFVRRRRARVKIDLSGQEPSLVGGVIRRP